MKNAVMKGRILTIIVVFTTIRIVRVINLAKFCF